MLGRSVVVFLVVTFAISWGLPAAYVQLVSGAAVAAEGLDAGVPIVHLVSIFGPAIGGVLAAASYGRGAVRVHCAYLMRLAIGWRWYLSICAAVAAMYLTVALIGYWAGGWPVYELWSYVVFVYFLPPPLSDGGPIEELGFRGWLLPLLQTRYRPHTAAVIVGVLWFLFHYSVLLPGFPFTMHAAPNWELVAYFFIQIMALSFFFTVMFNASGGSVPLVFVAHWLINAAIKLQPFSVPLAAWPCVLAAAAILAAAAGRRYLTDQGKVALPQVRDRPPL